MDNHGSHYTPEFINFAVDNGIIPYCFIPYITHICQPLDNFPSSITNSPPLGISRINESTRKLEADIELLDSKLYPTIRHRAKLLCRSARITAELATQLTKDNTTLLRHKAHRDTRVTKRQINLGGPLTAGDTNRIIRARESKEQVQEEKRLKKRTSKQLTTEDTPTPAPRFIPWIPPMDDVSTI
ncbi:unnamed protein product [Penicillium camemberti]|uniref:Str. FM013 n=1 Tax=Penicillium camemberti (strain FM 013) TaxID=1429867 RepID=A0A0G4PTL5_PENC3|nr:unnamed protein product [Penicillium camemberti]